MSNRFSELSEDERAVLMTALRDLEQANIVHNFRPEETKIAQSLWNELWNVDASPAELGSVPHVFRNASNAWGECTMPGCMEPLEHPNHQ